MRRLAVVACALAIVACGAANGADALRPSSAQTVASNSGDFSGLTRCPESGTWDHYLSAEQSKNPSQYATDKSELDTLRSAGANDTYVVVYADSSSGCGAFGSNTPTGKLAEVYAIRFKDAAAAGANFKNDLKDFHLSDSDLTSIKAAGGIVTQGSATALGDNSVVVSFAIAGVSFYAAFWQKNQFEVAMITFNVTEEDSKAASTKINGRMH